MTQNEYYKAVKEGVLRASKIRKDLGKYPTEYYPEKVRGLNKAYIETIKEIIRQGNLYLDNDPHFWLGLEVAQITENYSAFLSTLNLKGREE